MPRGAESPWDRSALRDVAWLFLRLGLTAFGGPAAHIALLEDEVVRRRRWISRDAFIDYLGATNLLPGPNSTEMVMHVGYLRAGGPGLIVAGVCFILPAAVLVGLSAAVYVRYGTLPAVAAVLYGVSPVVVAVVAQALWGLGRAVLTRPASVVVALAAVVAAGRGVGELVVLGGAAAITALVRLPPTRGHAARLVGVLAPQALAAGSGTVAAPFALWPMFLVFLKVGSVLFGSGYVLLAFLRAEFVERLGWLTERQLLDATAMGLVTPGPVFTTATFIGYLLGGRWGAILATVGIFLPAFVFVALSGRLVPRLRRSPLAAAVLDGVNAASLALMAVVAWHFGRTAIADAMTLAVALTAGWLLVARRVNASWLVLGGALVGWLVG